MSGRRYTERPPAPGFERVVLCSWSFAVEHAPDGGLAHDVWPDGCVSVSIAAEDGVVRAVTMAGPNVRARRVVMRAGQTVYGLRCWPDSAAIVLGVDPVRLRGARRDATVLLPTGMAERVAASPSDHARDAAWGEWLATRAAGRDPVDVVVRRTVERLVASDGAMSIAEAAAGEPVGLRQLERRFRRATGLTPKQFARVRRVRALIGLLLQRRSPWSTLAAEAGFADQAHLVREVRAITGLTPRALLTRLGEIEHDGVVA